MHSATKERLLPVAATMAREITKQIMHSRSKEGTNEASAPGMKSMQATRTGDGLMRACTHGQQECSCYKRGRWVKLRVFRHKGHMHCNAEHAAEGGGVRGASC